MRCFKRRHCEKLCCERTSQFTFAFTFSVVVVDLPTDCILSFLFPAATDVLVPVFSQSTDVVVVNSVVVLKFPNMTIRTTKTVESVQLSGVVVSVAVVLKFPNMTIRTTKTVESIHLKGRIKIFGCFPPFYLPLHLCYYLPKHIVLLFDSWKPFGHLKLLLS